MIYLNGIKEGFHIIDPDCLSHPVEIDNYTPAMAENISALVESKFLLKFRMVDTGSLLEGRLLYWL